MFFHTILEIQWSNFFFSFLLYDQTNLSFEAQEVSSPTNNPTPPQWRQKVTVLGCEDIFNPHKDILE